MIYKLSKSVDRIEPMPFLDFSGMGNLEKQLENLLADHLLETLYEADPLLPFFQERNRQEEADIYALDRNGDLVVFELKRSGANRNALEQLFRYVEEASSWDYYTLDSKFRQYRTKRKGEIIELKEAHRLAFGLTEQLEPDLFNRKQRMYVVANSGEEGFVRAISYWRDRGLNIDFLPYRVYEIAGERYFEFFSKPFDAHLNLADAKGVIVDTNASYDIQGESSWIERMITKKRVSAYGDIKGVIDYLRRGDIVFYYQKGYGIVAAARITGRSPKEYKKDDERYWDVEFLTAYPRHFEPPYVALTVPEIRAVLGFNFYWAKTLKVPYLNSEESKKLLEAGIKKLGRPA